MDQCVLDELAGAWFEFDFYTVSQKNHHTIAHIFAIYGRLIFINFYRHIQQEICDDIITKDPAATSDINISQGIVATGLRCGGIFNDHFIVACASEIISKIGQHLEKLRTYD